MGCGCGQKQSVRRTVYSKHHTLGTAGERISFKLPPQESGKSWAVMIHNRETLSGANDTNLFFVLMPEGNFLPAFVNGDGDYIPPGAVYHAPLAGDIRDFTLDVRGILASDFTTAAAVSFQLTIKECGTSGKVPEADCPESAQGKKRPC